MPNVLVGLFEGSSMFTKWYFEAEVEHLEQMTTRKVHLRVGWANTTGYVPYPGTGQKWGCNGVGDDLFSYGFDGKRCRFLFGGNQGKLHYGPPKGYSAIYEALRGPLKVGPCFSFGKINRCIYNGPSTILLQEHTFAPKPVDIAQIMLSAQVEAVTDKLAENMHELWAVNKIEDGWTYGDKRSESRRNHPCLTTYEKLGLSEKTYNLNLARDTIKAIIAMGYHIAPGRPPNRLKLMRFPNNFLMSNGYKPAPLDTREIQLDEKMMDLVELLAKNTHYVWAKDKIGKGWTYGANDDPLTKRSCHLVPYDFVDSRIKDANRAMSTEVIKYYEFEVITDGYMKVGWMDVGAAPDVDIGNDELSFGFDGFLTQKWHQGHEQYGKKWTAGDVIGCFLDLTDKIVCKLKSSIFYS
uniref:B30.2/SPRY domain-containing protein n=1 Tax=Romanomermis culicivorax TaxID=13658 RepID=A0A915K5J2_ROMCU